MKLSRILALFVFMSALLVAGVYKVDTSHTSVGFKIKHLMISNVTGVFGIYDGKIEYDKKSKKIISIMANVDASSIDTDNEKRDEHLRSADFFDVEKFGDITFKSTKVTDDYVMADFTIKGITKSVKFEIEDLADVVGPKGKHRIGFALKAKIDRTEFGLTWSKLLETGGVMVGNEVKIAVEVEAIEAN